MDNFAMIRSFDNAGYYETRFILMIPTIAIVLYMAIKKKDRSYLAIFISSVFFFGIVELILQLMTTRGEGFTISLFGLEIPGYITWLFQGLTEGGVHGIMGYLFLDIYLKHNNQHNFKSHLIFFSGMLILIFVFAIIVGFLAKDQPITSVRPIFTPLSILYPIIIIAITLVLAKFKGGDNIFRYLGIYLLGTLVYVVVNLETMHMLGVRYIGILLANGDIIVAEPFYQIVIMLYSDLIETTVSRGHYFIIPLILGFVKLDKQGVTK